MSAQRRGYLPLDNDWEYEYDVVRKNTATGELEAATGLTGITAHLSLTNGGAALSGTSVNLAERSATPGRYWGVLDLVPLNAALSTRIGKRVWEVFKVSGAVETSEAVIVTATRPPE